MRVLPEIGGIKGGRKEGASACGGVIEVCIHVPQRLSVFLPVHNRQGAQAFVCVCVFMCVILRVDEQIMSVVPSHLIVES